ncbi:argininosuccinate lyase [Agrobacterium vitis]|uniref:argininosuccinate lyase n=1 Tax=Agrobacterium vitis TaxID=373 RepID=UPI0012E8531F|nr:argininosuccinate lyase [Agrobacterium vitis]MUZ65376.1 argininosuccinate lyase [Agrobacterium vitis]
MQNTEAFSAARLSRPPSLHVKQFYQIPGLEREKKQFAEFSQIDLAHTVMLVEQGIINPEIGRKILPVLLEVADLGFEGLNVDPDKGSLLFQIEAFLAGRLGEDIAGAVHTARSRIDQSATARRLFKRAGLLRVMQQILELQTILLSVAGSHTATIMPSYTHMQQAQPGSFGHYLLSFVARLQDDFQRATEVFARVNLSPLGAVGLSGTGWPINRERTAELLGFEGLVYNSKLGREAYYAAEVAACLSFVMSDLNDLATDLHIWSSNEFDLVELDDSYCSTSSIFPQKKNPVTLETIKAAAGPAVTWTATALATFRGEGTGDQAIRSVSLLDAAFTTTAGMLELMGGIMETLIVHDERMKQSLSTSWSTSSNLADVLVRDYNLSFRQAHHVVARFVRICVTEGISRADASAMVLERASRETLDQGLAMAEDGLAAALDPMEFLRSRVSSGSVNPLEVEGMIASSATALKVSRTWLSRKTDNLEEAKSDLDKAIRNILA